MTLGELETARRAGIGLTIVVVNNAASGYVKALQHAMFRGRYQSSDLVEMDYAAIARAMGCHGIRVEDPEPARRGPARWPRRAHAPDRARHRRDPRPRPHAARRRQPHGRDQAGRPRRLSVLFFYHVVGRSRSAALATAFNEAVTMSLSMPTP